MSDEHDLKPMGDATDLAAKVPDAPSAVEPKVDLIADLPEKEIRDRLRLVNPALVDEIYELAKAQVESERARHIMLNSKAASILTASGVSLTLSLTLAGPLLAGKVVLPTLLSCGFALAGLLGLAAVLSAVLSLFVVGGFAYVSDHAVFDKKILDFADSPTGCEDLPDPSDKYAFGAAAYRQHMTAHLWAVSAKEHRQLDKKANQVRAAQWLFTLFAVLISTCGASLFWVISSQNKDAREAAAAQVVPNAGQATQASAASAARSTANSGPRSSPHSGGANAAGGATF
jgi:hypothetical protein